MGWRVAGCSRKSNDLQAENYRHYELDISNETAVVAMIRQIKRDLGPIDALINNAGTASMNHLLLTRLPATAQFLIPMYSAASS